MGDTEAEELLNFDDFLDDESYRALYGEQKRKSPDKETPPSPLQAITERRDKMRLGCDFSIVSERNSYVSWMLPVRDAALSGILLHHCIQSATPQSNIKIPSTFDLLVIDIMVSFLLYGQYRLTNPLQLRYAQGATDLNEKLTSIIDTTVPVLIHLSVFDIAILMDIPELTSEAMQKMHHILSQRSKHVPIEHFEKLVSRAWKEQDNDTEMDVHGQIHVLRRRIATYGVVMQYAFEEENLKLHRQLINPDGKYSKYGRWHSKADALVKTRSNYTFPPFIQTLMNKSKAEKAAKAAREAEDAARAARNSRNAENTQNAEDAENAESTDSEN